MADEFPGALRNDFGNGAKKLVVKRSRNLDTQSSVGSKQSRPFCGIAKAGRHGAEDSHLGVARPKTRARQQFTRSKWLARPERIADGTNPAGLCRAQHRSQYGRK